MTVAEFVKLDVSGMLFRIVDADRNGYMTHPYILLEGDKNVITQWYGEYEIVGFEGVSKRTIMLYIKK